MMMMIITTVMIPDTQRHLLYTPLTHRYYEYMPHPLKVIVQGRPYSVMYGIITVH